MINASKILNESPIARIILFIILFVFLSRIIDRILPYDLIYMGLNILLPLLISTIAVHSFAKDKLVFILKIGKSTLKNIAFGLAFASGLYLFILFVLIAADSEITFSRINIQDFAVSFMAVLIAASSEEIGFRGVLLQNLSLKLGKVNSTLLLALVFVLFHFFNPNISNVALFNIFLAGILFSVMYFTTKSLWLSISFHTFWNFLQGNIFGIKVSGISSGNSLLAIKYNDSLSMIIGGNFGFEEGFITTVYLIMMIFVCIIISRKQKG